MSTLISAGNNNGERRCDEKCYGATGGKCDCICGGMNHGIGFKKAVENTQIYAKELLIKIKKENPRMSVTIDAIQESLF